MVTLELLWHSEPALVSVFYFAPYGSKYRQPSPPLVPVAWCQFNWWSLSPCELLRSGDWLGLRLKCLDRGTDTRVWGIYDLICIRLGFPFFSSKDFVWRSTSRCIWCHYSVGSKCLTLPSSPPPPSRTFSLSCNFYLISVAAHSSRVSFSTFKYTISSPFPLPNIVLVS